MSYSPTSPFDQSGLSEITPLPDQWPHREDPAFVPFVSSVLARNQITLREPLPINACSARHTKSLCTYDTSDEVRVLYRWDYTVDGTVLGQTGSYDVYIPTGNVTGDETTLAPPPTYLPYYWLPLITPKPYMVSEANEMGEVMARPGCVADHAEEGVGRDIVWRPVLLKSTTLESLRREANHMISQSNKDQREQQSTDIDKKKTRQKNKKETGSEQTESTKSTKSTKLTKSTKSTEPKSKKKSVTVVKDHRKRPPSLEVASDVVDLASDFGGVDFEAKERAPVSRVNVDARPPEDGITHVQAPTRSRKILVQFFPSHTTRSKNTALKIVPSGTSLRLVKNTGVVAAESIPSEKVLSFRMAHPQIVLVEDMPCYKLNTTALTGLPVLIECDADGHRKQLAIVTDLRGVVTKERDTTLFMPEQHQRVAPFLLGPANNLSLRSLLVWHPTGSGKSYVAAELAARWAEHTTRNLLAAMETAGVSPSAKKDTIMKHAVFQHFLWQGTLRREDDFPGVERDACLSAVRPVVVVTRSIGNQSGAIAQQLRGDLARVANFLGAVSQLSTNFTHKDLRTVVDNVSTQTTKRTSKRKGGLAAQDKGHVLPPFLIYVTDLFNFGNSMPFFLDAKEEEEGERKEDTHCWCKESAAPPLDVSLAVSKTAQRMPDNPTNATFTCGRFSNWSSHSVHATGGAHLNNNNIDLISPVRELARLIGDGIIPMSRTGEEEENVSRRSRVQKRGNPAKRKGKEERKDEGEGEGEGETKSGLNAAGVTVRMLKNRSDRRITSTERAALAGWSKGRGLDIGIDWDTSGIIYASEVADVVADMILRWNPLDGCVVIVDEAHELFVRPEAPAPTALAPTMRLRRAIADARDLVYCPMTATPVQKSVSDFLCQINMLRSVDASGGPTTARPEAMRLGDLVNAADFKPKPEALLKVQGYISFYETDSDRHLYATFLPHRKKGQLLQPSTILKAPMSAEMITAMEAANKPTVRVIRDRSQPKVFPPLNTYVSRQVAVLRVGDNRLRNVKVRGPVGLYAVIDSVKPGGPLRAIRMTPPRGAQPGEGKWVEAPDPDDEDNWLWKPSLEEDVGGLGWAHPSFADDDPCGYRGITKKKKRVVERDRPVVMGTIQIYRKKTDPKTREETVVLDTKHTYDVYFIADGLWVTLPGKAKARKDQALVEALERPEEDDVEDEGEGEGEEEDVDTLCDRLEAAFDRWIFVEDKDAIFPVLERKFVSGFIPNAKVQVPTQFYKPPTPLDVGQKAAYLMSSIRVQNFFLSVTPSWTTDEHTRSRVSRSTQQLLTKAIGVPTSMVWAEGQDTNHVSKLRELSKVLRYCPRGKGIVFSQFPASLHALANYLVGLRGGEEEPLFEMVNPHEWRDPSPTELRALRSTQHRSPIRFALLHPFGSVDAEGAPSAEDIRKVARYFQTGASASRGRLPVHDPNSHGEVIAFVLAPISVYGQSVNFRNIRTVANMEPQASATLTIQSQGRARRDCKHSDLSYIDGEWSIQLYEAVSVLPSTYGQSDHEGGRSGEEDLLTDRTEEEKSTSSPRNLLMLAEERERNAVRQALAAEAIGAQEVGDRLNDGREAALQAEEDAEIQRELAAIEEGEEKKDRDYDDGDRENDGEEVKSDEVRAQRRPRRARNGHYDKDGEYVVDSKTNEVEVGDEELETGGVMFLEGEKRDAKQARQEAMRLASEGRNVFVEMATSGRVYTGKREDGDNDDDDADEDGEGGSSGSMLSFTLLRLILPFLSSPPLRSQMEGALSGSVLPTSSSGGLLQSRLLSPDQWVWANARMDYLLQFIFQRYLALTAVDCHMVASRIPTALQSVSLTTGPKHCYEYASDMPLARSAALPDATKVVARWFGSDAADQPQTAFWRSWVQTITADDVLATKYGQYGAAVENLRRKLMTSFARCTITPNLARVLLSAAASLTAKPSGKSTTYYYAKNGPTLPSQLSQRKLWNTRLYEVDDFACVDIMERLQDTIPKGDNLTFVKAKTGPKRRPRDSYGADVVTVGDDASTVVMVFGDAAARA